MSFSTIRAFLFPFAFGSALLGLAGCQRTKPTPPAMPPAKVTVAKPATVPVQSYYEYNGYLEAVETVQVKARVKGILQRIEFTEGEEVDAGDPLYAIDPREYKAAVARADADVAKAVADIDNWKAQIKLAQTELGRLSRTAATGASAQADLDKAKATLEVNNAQLAVAVASKDAAEAALQTSKIQLGYATIEAPIAGRINRTLVTPGNLVGQSEPTLLTTIVSMDPLYVYFDVPERDLVEYQAAQRGKSMPDPASGMIPVEVGVSTETGYPHRGTIDFRENRVDTGTGTVRIRGRVPNPQVPPNNVRLLYPGLYSRVRVPTGAPQPRLVLPEEALMTGQEGRYVYVVGDDNKVEKRTVTVGTRVWRAPPGAAELSGWELINPNPAPPAGPNEKGGAPPPGKVPVKSVVAIETGLKEGDRVVVNGLQKARPGAPVAPEEWQFKAPPEKK
jgi:membrane fusion protein, multidrug efflux system